MIKAGIIGGSGYTGGELLRLLAHHPSIVIQFVYSTTKVGMHVSDTHPDLLGVVDLQYISVLEDCDVLFLCTGHGTSKAFLENNTISPNTKIVDLSRDFRLKADQRYEDRSFVYGLPALYRQAIQNANNIANPGCFATAIQLALLPLAKGQQLTQPVHINAVTGSTGAGAKLSETTHFSWRNGNVSWYKAFTHQHLGEIVQSLAEYQSSLGRLFFLPNRGNFTRGIYVTGYMQSDQSLSEVQDMYRDYYSTEPFVHISTQPISLKPVVNTNNCHIHLHREDDQLLITAAIDNLLKGASGQAVQNMNLMFGLNETEGLQLKSSFF